MRPLYFPLAWLSVLLLIGSGLCGCAGNLAERDMAFLTRFVAVEGALGDELLPADQAAEALVRVRLGTKPVQSAIRPTINLALVIDTSGSMSGQPIDDARAAALALVDQLLDGDRLAVVAFHSTTDLLLPSTRLNKTLRTMVRDRIQKMAAHGTTDMRGGLMTGLKEVRDHLETGAVNRIVLLSDGNPNDSEAIPSLALQARQLGITVTALGLGLEYNESLLADVARSSGGSFRFVEQSSEVAEVFRSEVLRLKQVVARNLQLSFVPGPGVTVRRVVGQQVEPSAEQRTVVHLGDLSEGEERDVLVRLDVGPHRLGATVELLDAVVRFDDALVGEKNLEKRIFLSVKTTDNPDALNQGRNEGVLRSLEKAEAASAMVDAIAAARSNRLAMAVELLDRAEPVVRDAAQRFNDDALRTQADDMAKLRQALPSVVPQPAAAPLEAPARVETSYTPVQPAPAAPQAFPEDASYTIRRSHNEAVKALQSH